MKNAKDLKEATGYKILLLGEAGSGKTVAYTTLPGRKFAYLFDPNATASIVGADLDYEEFLPDNSTFALKSLSKEGKKDKSYIVGGDPEAYRMWEEHFEGALKSGFFSDYRWVIMDSGTTFSDLVLDRVLMLNNRAGQHPQQDDYPPAMAVIRNVFRCLTSLIDKEGTPINVLVTGHLEVTKDETTGRILKMPLMMGKLKQRLPILFSDLLVAEASTGPKGEVVYNVRLAPDRMIPNVRSSLHSVGGKTILDVTVDWKKPREGQGLGKYFK